MNFAKRLLPKWMPQMPMMRQRRTCQPLLPKRVFFIISHSASQKTNRWVALWHKPKPQQPVYQRILSNRFYPIMATAIKQIIPCRSLVKCYEYIVYVLKFWRYIWRLLSWYTRYKPSHLQSTLSKLTSMKNLAKFTAISCGLTLLVGCHDRLRKPKRRRKH